MKVKVTEKNKQIEFPHVQYISDFKDFVKIVSYNGDKDYDVFKDELVKIELEVVL